MSSNSQEVEIIAGILDAARSMGSGSELIILRGGKIKGYEPVLTVKRGWCLEDRGVGQYQALCVVELGDCTRDVLLQARLFSIDNAIYEIAEGTEMTGPPRNAKLPEWTFVVAPTTESYP